MTSSGSEKKFKWKYTFRKTKQTYQAKLLTSVEYVTTYCMSVASQSKGLKWLLIFL